MRGVGKWVFIRCLVECSSPGNKRGKDSGMMSSVGWPEILACLETVKVGGMVMQMRRTTEVLVLRVAGTRLDAAGVLVPPLCCRRGSGYSPLV